MVNKEDVSTISFTLKIKNKEVVGLENFLKDNYNLIDYSILADTSKMYKEDKVFQKIIKQTKEIKNLKLDYINKNNHKWK